MTSKKLQSNYSLNTNTNYNLLKHYISKLVLMAETEQDLILPSYKKLSKILNISKSSIERAILKIEKNEKWIVKMKVSDTPRGTFYKITATPEQIKLYQDDLLFKTQKLKLPHRRHTKKEEVNKRKIQLFEAGAENKPSKNEFYIYRFLNKSGEIMYIGKTDNIIRRMQQHFSRQGRLPKECYKSVKVIEYITLESKA